jgi:hypothetical protein
VDFPILLSGQPFKLFHSLPVFPQGSGKSTATISPTVSAEAARIRTEFSDCVYHTGGERNLWSFTSIREGIPCFSSASCASFFKGVPASPSFSNRLDHPKPHDIFEVTVPALVATLVSIVRRAAFFRAIRQQRFHPHQRPGSGTQVDALSVPGTARTAEAVSCVPGRTTCRSKPISFFTSSFKAPKPYPAL